MYKSKSFARGNNRRRASGNGRSNSNPRRAGAGRFKKYINPEMFVNRAVEVKDEVVYEPQHQFVDFGFSTEVQRNLDAMHYVDPSPIQDQTIPAIMAGHDLLGLANTGTGKTAAFLLPTIEKVMKTRKPRSVLIMAPTRELAQQIDSELKHLASGVRIYSTIAVGGMPINRQISDLRRGPHFIIGTPGRLNDLIKRGELKLATIDTFILDEVDRMLDMGFVHDIKTIAGQITAPHQTLAFSATITPTVQEILRSFVKPDHKKVSVKTAETNNHIAQDIIRASDKEQKHEILQELLRKDEFAKVLIFTETKHAAQRLAEKLTKAELPAVAIHGNKSQSQRVRALNDFKSEKVRIMVATDVAARGIDVKGITHVINFDTPATYEDYVHRIGRTGRAGRAGTALTFVD
jgi:superfamily II DNA/RNA helicase